MTSPLMEPVGLNLIAPCVGERASRIPSERNAGSDDGGV